MVAKSQPILMNEGFQQAGDFRPASKQQTCQSEDFPSKLTRSEYRHKIVPECHVLDAPQSLEETSTQEVCRTWGNMTMFFATVAIELCKVDC